MKVVILAGGYGTRIAEESGIKPKPMVEVGPHPILWHIMKIYAHYGYDDFVICLGYKGHMIKRFFLDYLHSNSDLRIDLSAETVEVLRPHREPWKVTLVDTGEDSMTGGRLRRVAPYLTPGETFLLTYGDGVCDVNLNDVVAFHKAQGRLATLTAVQPPGRFGVFHLEGHSSRIDMFHEKPTGDTESSAWINGGFFALEYGVMDYIDHDRTTFEREPMERLARDGQLGAFRHTGFWQSMDTLRDKNVLDQLWELPNPPWRVWDRQG